MIRDRRGKPKPTPRPAPTRGQRAAHLVAETAVVLFVGVPVVALVWAPYWYVVAPLAKS